MQDLQAVGTDVALEFPTRAEELCDAWLDASLRGAGLLREGESVVGHRWEKVDGEGLTADVARIWLEYGSGRGARSETLVAKFASARKSVRALYGGTGTYEREVRFYQVLGPNPGIPTPACFAAEIDSRSGHFVLLLEDLGEGRVGKMGSLEDIELAVAQLAAFHARWWGAGELHEQTWLAGTQEPLLHGLNRKMWEGLLAVFKARHSDGAPRIVLEVADLIAEQWDRLAPSPSALVTLSHSDYRPGQIFFASEAGGRFAVSDWQTIAIESPGVDLAKIVTTGLGIRQRRQVGRRLVEGYHRTLLAHGVESFDSSALWQHYRMGLLSILVANLSALVILEGRKGLSGEGQPSVNFDRYFAQVAVALRDYEVLDLIRDGSQLYRPRPDPL